MSCLGTHVHDHLVLCPPAIQFIILKLFQQLDMLSFCHGKTNAVAGQPVMAHLPGGEPEAEDTEDMEEDGAAGISGMPDVMDKIMAWSED